MLTAQELKQIETALEMAEVEADNFNSVLYRSDVMKILANYVDVDCFVLSTEVCDELRKISPRILQAKCDLERSYEEMSKPRLKVE